MIQEILAPIPSYNLRLLAKSYSIFSPFSFTFMDMDKKAGGFKLADGAVSVQLTDLAEKVMDFLNGESTDLKPTTQEMVSLLSRGISLIDDSGRLIEISGVGVVRNDDLGLNGELSIYPHESIEYHQYLVENAGIHPNSFQTTEQIPFHGGAVLSQANIDPLGGYDDGRLKQKIKNTIVIEKAVRDASSSLIVPQVIVFGTKQIEAGENEVGWMAYTYNQDANGSMSIVSYLGELLWQAHAKDKNFSQIQQPFTRLSELQNKEGLTVINEVIYVNIFNDLMRNGLLSLTKGLKSFHDLGWCHRQATADNFRLAVDENNKPNGLVVMRDFQTAVLLGEYDEEERELILPDGKVISVALRNYAKFSDLRKVVNSLEIVFQYLPELEKAVLKKHDSALMPMILMSYAISGYIYGDFSRQEKILKNIIEKFKVEVLKPEVKLKFQLNGGKLLSQESKALVEKVIFDQMNEDLISQKQKVTKPKPKRRK